MNTKQLKRRLERLERASGLNVTDEPTYEQDDSGRYRIPASEILRNEYGSLPRLTRQMRQLAILSFGLRFRDYAARRAGVEFRHNWNPSREERRANREAEHDFATRMIAYLGGDDAVQEKRSKSAAELLERRRRAEKDLGAPVAFLYPIEPARVELLCGGKHPFAFKDPKLRFNFLTPIYSDGSIGDETLYPVTGPFDEQDSLIADG
jgi:hypothetical protein